MVVDKTDQNIRRPTKADIDFLVDNIREADLNEVEAISGKTVRECIEEIPDVENNSWVWEHDGKVMCIFGVNPVKGRECMGAIWMLSTKFFDDHFMIFATACRPILVDLIAPFKYLFNYVHEENEKSVKWLKWLGFKIYDAEPTGVNNAKFHYFEMWNENV